MPDFVDAKKTLRALGDVARLAIVQILAGSGEMNVSDLVEALNTHGILVSQPLLSWHLSHLKRSGLVRVRPAGRVKFYSLNRERFDWCLHFLSDLVAPTQGQHTRSSVPSSAESRLGLQTRR
jgi:ArsR family transcriptional regulator